MEGSFIRSQSPASWGRVLRQTDGAPPAGVIARRIFHLFYGGAAGCVSPLPASSVGPPELPRPVPRRLVSGAELQGQQMTITPRQTSARFFASAWLSLVELITQPPPVRHQPDRARQAVRLPGTRSRALRRALSGRRGDGIFHYLASSGCAVPPTKTSATARERHRGGAPGSTPAAFSGNGIRRPYAIVRPRQPADPREGTPSLACAGPSPSHEARRPKAVLPPDPKNVLPTKPPPVPVLRTARRPGICDRPAS